MEKKTGIQVSRVPLLDSSKVSAELCELWQFALQDLNSLNSTFGSGFELNNVTKTSIML